MSDREDLVFTLLQLAIDEHRFEKNRLRCFLSTSIEEESFTASLRDVSVSCSLRDTTLEVKIFTLGTLKIETRNLLDVLHSYTSYQGHDDATFLFSLPVDILFLEKNIISGTFFQARYHFEESLTICQGQLSLLSQDIRLLLSRPLSHLSFTCTGDPLSNDKIVALRRAIMNDSKSLNHYDLHKLLEELQRFTLAVSSEFMTLRSLSHLAKIVETHYWLRNNVLSSKSLGASAVRTILTWAFPACVTYTLGEREVLCIAIAISHIDDYERLTSSHIVASLQTIIPEVSLITQSFYVYGYQDDTSRSLYVEIEKKQQTTFTTDELQNIKGQLSAALHNAIEPVVSKIDIPVNEEEHTRNILLLSHELKRRTDKPQVLVQFVQQHAKTLEFSATIVRVVEDATLANISDIAWPIESEYLRIVPVSSSIVGHVRGKFPKHALSLSLYCAKNTLLRSNRTIDYKRSREYVITILRQIFGPLRDLNGGIMHRQEELLLELHKKLLPQEVDEKAAIEQFFLHMSSSVIRSLFSFTTLLKVYRSIKEELISRGHGVFLLTSQSAHDDLKESLENFLCLSFARQHKISNEELTDLLFPSPLSVYDFAITHFSYQQKGLFYCIFIRKNALKESINALKWRVLHNIVHQQASKEFRKSATFRLATPPLLIDPRHDRDGSAGMVLSLLYDGLVRYDEQGRVQPAIAERIYLSQDEKRYTISLKASSWSNGTALTASDFITSWKRALAPLSKTLYDHLFYPIQNARLIKAGIKSVDELGVSAVGPLELSIELETPTKYFLEHLCHWIFSPLPRQIAITSSPWWMHYLSNSLNCNGPFRPLPLTDDKKKLSVVKNEKYWNSSTVKLDQIDLFVVEDPSSALQLYKDGKLDWLGPVSASMMRSGALQEAILSHPVSSLFSFSLNTQRGILRSKSIRTALYLALHKEELIEHADCTAALEAMSILPKLLSQGLYERAHNIDTARFLLTKGLEELSLSSSKKNLRMTLTVCDQDPLFAIASTAQSQWKKNLDVDIEIEILNKDRYTETLSLGRYDIVSTTWHPSPPDPMHILSLFSSLSNSMNLSQWQHPEFLSVLYAVQKTTHEEERKRLIAQLERIAMEELPVLPICEYHLSYIKSPRLQDMYLSPAGFPDARFADLRYSSQ